jgi:hypothetical protein
MYLEFSKGLSFGIPKCLNCIYVDVGSICSEEW